MPSEHTVSRAHSIKPLITDDAHQLRWCSAGSRLSRRSSPFNAVSSGTHHLHSPLRGGDSGSSSLRAARLHKILEIHLYGGFVCSLSVIYLISLWTHEYLSYTLSFNPILPYFSCPDGSSFGCRVLFQLVPVSVQHATITAVLCFLSTVSFLTLPGAAGLSRLLPAPLSWPESSGSFWGNGVRI